MNPKKGNEIDKGKTLERDYIENQRKFSEQYPHEGVRKKTSS